MAVCQNNMYYPRRQQQNPSCGYNRQSSCGHGKSDSCGCDPCREDSRDSVCPYFKKGTPIAMAYVPWQKWCDLYDLPKAFQSGTIFRELDKPFLGKGGGCR